MAAKFGHQEILEWLLANDYPHIDKHVCYFAANGGQLDLLKWLRSRGVPWDRAACGREAVREKKHEVAKWIEEQGE